MAQIQLHRSFNLTAQTAYDLRSFGEDFAEYADGVRIDPTFSGYDRLSDVKITQNGGAVLEVSGADLYTGSGVEQHIQQGNILPIIAAVMAGGDSVIGSNGNDIVNGFSGNDAIVGRGGNDRLLGATGNDRMSGDGGSDILIGGAGNDALTGGLGADVLDGGTGNDRFAAGPGADVVRGGAGIDTVQVMTAANLAIDLQVSARQAFANGSLVLAGIENLAGNVGNDRLAGNVGANLLDGAGGNDRLAGRAGNDLLRGAAGNDVLDGMTGNDRMLGGIGADQFVFRPADGQDQIVDFTQNQDRIVFAGGPDGFADLRIVDRGPHTIVAYGADTITLVNVDHQQVDAGDFIFA